MKTVFFRLILPLLVLGVTLFSSGAMAAASPTACPKAPTDSQTQVLNGVGQTTTDCSGDGVTNVINVAVQILSLVAGIAAVVMIILAGFKYITSGGEASKVANAKNTLIYALVGIAIAVLAQFLVHFVLTQANGATVPACPANHSIKPPDCHN
jgi:hypothetical protein